MTWKCYHLDFLRRIQGLGSGGSRELGLPNPAKILIGFAKNSGRISPSLSGRCETYSPARVSEPILRTPALEPLAISASVVPRDAATHNYGFARALCASQKWLAGTSARSFRTLAL